MSDPNLTKTGKRHRIMMSIGSKDDLKAWAERNVASYAAELDAEYAKSQKAGIAYKARKVASLVDELGITAYKSVGGRPCQATADETFRTLNEYLAYYVLDHRRKVPLGTSYQNKNRKKAGDGQPKQTMIDFDRQESPAEKPRKTFRRFPIKGEPEIECKTKDGVIDDIRHWQIENQKILHAEHERIMSAVSGLHEVLEKMNAKLNMVTTLAYNLDTLFRTWKPIGANK